MSDQFEEQQKLEAEIISLSAELEAKKSRLKELQEKEQLNPYCKALSRDEICRYSRQMIMPQVTLKGQVKLKESKVLIVGAGGLGCPCALYLASAGVGNITIVDGDEVELTNLHRQVLHGEHNIGKRKVDSAKETLLRNNSGVNITPICMQLTSSNAGRLLRDFDVVIDGTDNVATRYLLNDACVLSGKCLVSGSALQMEGQLTVYNYKGGPCYRCLFPVPPPPDAVTSCGDGGVLGPVPGCIGVLQALETLKIILDMPGVLSGRFLVFDGADCTFRNIKLRNKSVNCLVCGQNATLKSLVDYEQFCQSKHDDKVHNINILNQSEIVDVKVMKECMNEPTNKIFIDVRPTLEFEMCRLPNFTNYPYADLLKNKNVDRIKEEVMKKSNGNPVEVYVICRRGNDSQRAINLLKPQLDSVSVQFFNVSGGLHSFSRHVDKCFPVY